MNGRKKIAAILTTCFTRSHAEVILPKLIKGFPTDNGMLEPQVDLASIYLDQIHEEDVCDAPSSSRFVGSFPPRVIQCRFSTTNTFLTAGNRPGGCTTAPVN